MIDFFNEIETISKAIRPNTQIVLMNDVDADYNTFEVDADNYIVISPMVTGQTILNIDGRLLATYRYRIKFIASNESDDNGSETFAICKDQDFFANGVFWAFVRRNNLLTNTQATKTTLEYIYKSTANVFSGVSVEFNFSFAADKDCQI